MSTLFGVDRSRKIYREKTMNIISYMIENREREK